MRKLVLPLTTLLWACLLSCDEIKKPGTETSKDTVVASVPKTVESAVTGRVADAATILARKEVPVLCYHQIRDWTASDSKNARDYIRPVEAFKADMKLLADSGYHSI